MFRMSSVSSMKTPQAILDFWLGPLRSADDTNEENWRERMSKWRVGVFARGAEDQVFLNYQREWYDDFISNPNILSGWEKNTYGCIS